MASRGLSNGGGAIGNVRTIKTAGIESLNFWIQVTHRSAVRDLNPKIQTFDASCFDGSYITGDVTTEYLDRLEYMRKHPEVLESGGLQMNLGYSANQ